MSEENDLMLVIFDFDWSLVNENSDLWIFDQLSPQLRGEVGLLKRNEYCGQWTQLMDYLVGKLMSEQNVGLDAVNTCLRHIPVFEETIEAVKLAFSCGAELAILSDANTHYISVILDHLKIGNLFTKIVTNGSIVCDPAICGLCKDSGNTQSRLHIFPYQPTLLPHGCSLCPANLCKGIVLDSWRRDGRFTKIIYIGDGGGDYCPCTRLTSADTILCRDGWALDKALETGSIPIHAEVRKWQSGFSLLQEMTSILGLRTS